jgi:hypothetical protein
MVAEEPDKLVTAMGTAVVTGLSSLNPNTAGANVTVCPALEVITSVIMPTSGVGSVPCARELSLDLAAALV